jgi:hypothetical protein
MKWLRGKTALFSTRFGESAGPKHSEMQDCELLLFRKLRAGKIFDSWLFKLIEAGELGEIQNRASPR